VVLAFTGARRVSAPIESSPRRSTNVALRPKVLALYLPFGIAYIGVIYWVGTYLEALWESVPPQVRRWIEIAGYSLLGLALAAGLLAFFPDIWRTARSWVSEMGQWRRLRKIEWPDVMSPEAVYGTALAFSSVNVRRAYLEGVRRRRIRIEGPIVETPSELLRDPSIEEKVARLREQWFEMAG
jgi:hypothetical protein